MSFPRTLFCRSVLALSLGAAAQAQAAVNFDVSFVDAAGTYSSYYDSIRSNLTAAGNQWLAAFQGPMANTTLTVQIGFGSMATANGRSATSSLLGKFGGLDLYEQGAAAKLKSGLDMNGAAADIEFNIGTDYLQNNLWFDPNPVAQAAIIPASRTDARSVFLHEFGHAFGFNGWRDGNTGALPGNYQSTFDALVQPLGGALYFTGAAAQAVYGGPVPVTMGNYAHIGNNAPLSGADLIPDMMNGVVYYYSTRYQISALDLAMMQDMGLPVAAPVPEPASAGLLALGALVVAAKTARRRRAAAAV